MHDVINIKCMNIGLHVRGYFTAMLIAFFRASCSDMASSSG
jgi:hypothetical protein